jgi:WD40 repeat protein
MRHPERLLLLLLASCDRSSAGALPDGPVGPSCGMPGAHLAPARTLDLPGLGTELAWSPDGRSLAVGGHFRDPQSSLRYDTKIFDAGSGTLARSLDCHVYWAIAAAWAPSAAGEAIASGSFGHAVQLWHGDARGSQSCPGNPPPSLQALKADGAIAVLPEIDGAVTSLAFSPDGRFLAAANRDPTVRLWQLSPGPHQFQVVKLWFEDAAGNYLWVAWSPDGTRLVTGDSALGRVAVWSFDPSRDLWDDATIADFAATGFTNQLPWFKSHPAAVTAAPLWASPGHGKVWTARFSPDGTRVAAAADDQGLWQFDAQNGQQLSHLSAPAPTAFEGMDYSPDGRWLAAGGADHAVYVFDAHDGTLRDTLTGHADVVAAVAWSPDGCTLASTAGGGRLDPAIHQNATGPDMTARLWSYP